MDDLDSPREHPAGASPLEDRVARLEAEVARLQGLVGSRVGKAERFTRTAAPPPPPVATATGSVPVPAAQNMSPDRPAREPLPVPAAAQIRERSLENRLGSQVFNRIGIVLLLIGVSWFLKLAVDRGWFVPSPTARVVFGLLAGAAIVLWSERFRSRGFAAFSYSLKALGAGVLYLSLWAAFRVYGLIPAGVALALMLAVTAWNAYMAWVQNAELLAAYALAGGFATPLLLSTGGNHESFLFTYLLVIDAATVVLVRLKGWSRLLLGAFPATVVFFIGWYSEFFQPDALVLTSLFVVLFDCTFSSVPIARRRSAAEAALAGVRRRVVEDILLPIANAAFLTLAFYSVLQDSGHHSLIAWMVVLFAAVYLGFMRLPQSRTASAIHLSIAVVLLTVAIPLKASGHWITAGWLVEGLALLWISLRLEAETGGERTEAANASVVRWMAAGGLALGWAGVLLYLVDALARDRRFWSADTATALLAVAVFVAAMLLIRARASGGRVWHDVLIGLSGAIESIAVTLSLREIAVSWSATVHLPFRSPAFGSACLGLAVFAGVIAASLWAQAGSAGSDVRQQERSWTNFRLMTIVAFNVVAVLTGVREVSSIWEGGNLASVDGALKQALAISGFLMMYGAALLIVGFLRSSAFLRWQGLVLLLFTILKTFLYDMRNLSQGYRVVSFLALGALLMAVSFAYQRDWLALKAKPAEQGREADV